MAGTSKTKVAGLITLCGAGLAFVTNAAGAVGAVKDFWSWLFAGVPVKVASLEPRPTPLVIADQGTFIPSPSPTAPQRPPTPAPQSGVSDTVADTDDDGPRSPTVLPDPGSLPVAPPPAPAVPRQPTSWTLTADDALASQVLARAALPGETRFKGRQGFRVLVTLEPATTEAPHFAYAMKGGRLGEFYRFVSGGGQTSQGFGCQAWLETGGLSGAWAIEGNALPARDVWPTLKPSTRLNISYWCDGPVSNGDTVSFGFGLYLMDSEGRARMASWSGSELPVRVQSVSLVAQ